MLTEDTPENRSAEGGAVEEQAAEGHSAPRRRWSWRRLLRSVVIIYVLVHVGLFFIQRRLLYLPYVDCELPARAAQAGVVEVELTTEDEVKLKAWWWPQVQSQKMATAVLFHGNAGHRGHRLRWLKILHDIGLSVFIVDYRGYGDSEGSPTEAGLYLDGRAAVEWVQQEHARRIATGGIDSATICYLGNSLGTGVAVEVARIYPPDALILQAAYSSMVTLAAETYPYLWVGPLVRDRFDTLSKIADLRCATLLIHGDADTLIGAEHSRRLFKAAPAPKALWVRKGRGHEGLVDSHDYATRLKRFLMEEGALKE